ncbi:MAG: DEAD/DEAH box helicase [Rhodospirillum sp.]|nr:DEAD/DEAH box helicase [Rhodospirillum sp.]
MTFADLGLSPETLKAVEEVGYDTPTPIQIQAIPPVLMGRDVLGIAQTGTGKTAGFTLPMIDILASGRPKARMPRSLILAPTRELATQVSANFTLYGKYHKLTMALLIGGESMNEQQKILDRGVDVLIATPGRLIDLFERGSILLRDVKILVIDEADRMLDMGFIPDVERIVGLLPPLRQTLFFSATMGPEIKRLADAFLMNPKEIRVEPTRKAADTVEQGLVTVKAFDKREALRHLLRREEVSTAFIFCNRKRDVDVLERSLKKHGFDAVALHGDMAQYVRTERLEKFKRGEIKLLVCSDVAARGIDVTEISHVFNFDVPSHAEDYIHRIGRTGRAGKSGHAYTIATPEDAKYLRAIENLLGKAIPPIHLEELVEANPDSGTQGEGEGEGRPDRGGRGANRRSRGRNRDRSSESRGDSRIEPQVETRIDPQVEAHVEIEAEPAKTPSPRETKDRDSRSGSQGRGNGNGASSNGNGGNGNGGRKDRKDPRPPAGRGRRRGRWEDDPQNDVMEMDIRDDVIGFGGFTPAFLLEPPTFSPMSPLDDDGEEFETDETVEEVVVAPPAAPVEEKPKRKRTPRKRKPAVTEAQPPADSESDRPDEPTESETSVEAETAQSALGDSPLGESLIEETDPEGDATTLPTEETGPEGDATTLLTEEAPTAEEKPKRKRTPRKRAAKAETAEAPTEAPTEATTEGNAPADDEKPKRKRAPRKKKVETETTDAPAEVVSEGDAPAAEDKPKRKRAPRKRATKLESDAESAEKASTTEPTGEAPGESEPAPEAD